MAADEAPMLAELRARLDAFDSAGRANLAHLHDRSVWGMDVPRDPLYVIWDGDPQFGYIVRHALALWNVIGIWAEPVGQDFYGMKFTGEAAFRAAAETVANLRAIVLRSDIGHQGQVAQRAGIPWVPLHLVRQTAGIDPVAAALAPHIAANLAVLDRLADELSRRTLVGIQLFGLTRDPGWLEGVVRPIEEIYFRPGLFDLGTDEVLIDGGASLGDTVETFEQATGGRYRHIHAFEPSPVGAGLMRRMFAGRQRITVHQKGLAESTASVGFRHEVSEQGVINGVVDEHGGETVPTVALDDLELGPVSFVKLDIEGFEVSALRGARRTIARYRPRMAICAYHKPDDFAQISTTVLAIRPDYKCCLRLHSAGGGDSVFYFT